LLTWNGCACKCTKAPITNREINAGLANPTVKAQLEEIGSVPMALTPAEFGAFVAAETEKWGRVVKLSGAKLD